MPHQVQFETDSVLCRGHRSGFSGWRGRRDYPRELRARIILSVQRHIRSGTAVGRLARDLGVPLSTLTVWTEVGAAPRSRTNADFREVQLSDATLVEMKPETAGPIVERTNERLGTTRSRRTEEHYAQTAADHAEWFLGPMTTREINMNWDIDTD